MAEEVILGQHRKVESQLVCLVEAAVLLEKMPLDLFQAQGGHALWAQEEVDALQLESPELMVEEVQAAM
ncbi:hypothetical protein WDR79_005046 [Citrobacter freundii]|nr:hypothetical protein [Citrobacter freundii]